MSDHSDPMIVPATAVLDTRGSGIGRPRNLQHITVDAGNDIAVCTMFPHRLEEDEMGSTWISATGDAFVSLEDAQ